jgi:hemolysin activation/secretion protein
MWVSLAGVMSVLPLVGLAQQRPSLPSTVQPGAIERERQAARLPIVAPPPPAPIAPLPEQQAPADAAELTFVLRTLEVEGATAIGEAQLTAPYTSRVGTTITVQNVYSIANAMTVRYRNAGYILSQVIVPPQTITDGHVRLQVVEGYVAQVRFQGYQARTAMLEHMAARVTAERPLRNTTLERFGLLLNDLPGVTTQTVLKPADIPGAADLVVTMRLAEVGGSLGGSNRGSRLEGPYRYQAALDGDSLLGLYESTSVQVVAASPATELRLYSGSHTERLTAGGLDLTVSGSRSEANPALAGELAQLNLATDTTQIAAALSYPLIRTRARNLSVHGSITYNDSVSASSGLALTEDRISALRAGLTADYLDAWGGVSTAQLEIARGLHIFGASSSGDPLASRPGADPTFTKATLYLARLQGLGGGFSVLLALNGQYGFERLLVPEEFAYGGETFGRAYDPSELVGDSGAAGKLELRYTVERFGRFGATFYAFGEDGWVWQRPYGDSAPYTTSARSAGGGLRLTVSRWLTGYVELAKPVNHIVAALGNQDVRIFGGLQISLP